MYAIRSYYVCRKGECSLNALEFGIIELKAGDSMEYFSEINETAFIILGGKCDVEFDGTVWKNVGGRRTVFEGKAHSFYIPRRNNFV